MKHLTTILLSILALATVILFVKMHKVCSKIENIENTDTSDTTNITHSVSSGSSAKLAYIDVQRINSEYLFYQDVSKDFEAKQKRAEAEFSGKAQDFQKEYEMYMQKAQRGAFLSKESQQQQEASLMAKQENLKVLEQNLSIKLQNEMQQLDFQVKDTIMNCLKNFNRQAGYAVILNSVSILDAGTTENITDTILSILNSNYKLQHKEEAK